MTCNLLKVLLFTVLLRFSMNSLSVPLKLAYTHKQYNMNRLIPSTQVLYICVSVLQIFDVYIEVTFCVPLPYSVLCLSIQSPFFVSFLPCLLVTAYMD